MADLLVIVPTRNRPQAIAPLWQAWTETATGDADLLFALDDDDPCHADYLAAITATTAKVRTGPRLRMVGTLNAAALENADQYRFLGFMGDDHRPRTARWDARFVECLGGGTGIVYGNDLLQAEKMPTAVAMTSDIVRTLGYMAPPSMLHLCVDLVWKDWGDAMQRITYLDDLIIEHLHPAAGKAAMDAGYEDVNGADRVTEDTAAYHAYRDRQLAGDVTKLRGLL